MDSYGGGGYFVDEKAVRVENIFLEFLKSFRVDANSREPFYESEIEAMRPNESNTMFIDFSHVMRFNDILQKAISDEFLRFESYLKNACKRFVMELKSTFITDDNPNKDINVAFYNLPLIKSYKGLMVKRQVRKAMKRDTWHIIDLVGDARLISPIGPKA
ncbi:hypothetical protein EJD97_011277 [Solanum chilense]|uniref:MCM N-terminal domain-containing protein n=1 Tax=Solanum chilense TaxID=4083 RepID=A0A6N2AMN3_SOLCI|nr:hypothetical protein EJD97_011277 [Solanum chilense]